MNIKIGNSGEVKLIFVTKEAATVKGLEGIYEDLKSREIFEGSLGQVFSSTLDAKNKFLLVGIGESNKLTTENLRRAAFAAGKELMKIKEKSVQIILPEELAGESAMASGSAMAPADGQKGLAFPEALAAIIEGVINSEYAFEKYLGEKKTKPVIEELFIDVDKAQEVAAKEVIAESQNLIEAVFLARNLVNDPSMAMTPTTLAEIAKERLEKVGVKVKILGRKEIEKLEMGAFLAVAQGSDQEPKLIIMEYKGDPASEKVLAMVGKGLMFDSGGYNIKPTKSIEDMYDDMAGAASVIGAMEAIAKSGLKKNVTAVVAACENLISGSAYKPGDILKSMSGKTIEILNTDAEGRLTLADALHYTVDRIKPTKLIDAATLTGACVVALGYYATGAISNNQEFMKEVEEAGRAADELIWQLPNTPDYQELNKGYFADLRNTTESAGAIGAGLFLGEFVGEIPWVHLDIAGTAFLSKPHGYLPKGATGVPVKTLYYLAKNF